MVELALTMSLLTLILLGAVEFAGATYTAIAVSNAARAAAEYGAQTHATALDTGGMLTAAQNDFTINPSGLTLPTASESCACSDTGASVSCSSSTACPGAHVVVTLTVETQATYNPLVEVPGFSGGITLHGWANQTVLQ